MAIYVKWPERRWNFRDLGTKCLTPPAPGWALPAPLPPPLPPPLPLLPQGGPQVHFWRPGTQGTLRRPTSGSPYMVYPSRNWRSNMVKPYVCRMPTHVECLNMAQKCPKDGIANGIHLPKMKYLTFHLWLASPKSSHLASQTQHRQTLRISRKGHQVDRLQT